MSDEERARAIALLESTHQFPVDYAISVIAFHSEEVAAQVHIAVALGNDEHPPAGGQAQLSRGGKYASHRFTVHCRGAEDVLALYDRVRSVKGVVSVL